MGPLSLMPACIDTHPVSFSGPTALLNPTGSPGRLQALRLALLGR